ncbi:class I SAM-dependent methyltransferase [Mesorhizobium sp. RMAD-H1]|uniref:class I SAM-dependent methyltransferase n=1 Tax=Mesorhizobium sp. RMAD-H1 TaxID=2587065 RepID=UPI00161C9A1F|nr:class I SAM-dependent methyltransferase [Mesorhizobium sp. RMAD-H1]MBB2971950.1 16S rRNA (guanine1207-N2)-methyltransferase [Mesorhizobium sp. RMAD-H1]
MASLAQQTLFLPFENGILPPPGGGARFLAFGIEADAALEDAWKEVLAIVQPFRPAYLKLERAGFHVVPRLEGDALFDGGLMLLAKHRGRNEQWFADLLSRVASGGSIVICGEKKLGIDSFRKWAGKIAEAEDRLSKNHAVAFWMKRPAGLPGETIEALYPAAKRVDGRFHTAAGMFSHGEIDKGSALLARHLEGRLSGAVADFGAGWGYLSAECLKYPRKITKLDLYEADFEALEAARGNLSGLAGNIPVSFHWQDLVSEPLTAIYDTVVMNPPFHESRAADISLGRAFIAAAARRLKSGGRLLLVANRQLPYEVTLKSLFRSVETLEEGQGFKVVEARR